MTTPDDPDLTRDAFLGGRLHLLQPRKGYRAGIDAVMLSASVCAEKNQRVLELGCGAGVAILCLGARVPGLHLTGVERDASYAELARRNGGAALEVIDADLAALPQDLRQRQFDHVIANPPFYDRTASVASGLPAREAAHGAQTSLDTWVRVAAKRLAPKGQAHFIHRLSALPTILAALPGGMGSVEVLPLSARSGRDPDRMILRARKNGRADFRMAAPLILHAGAHHRADQPDLAPAVTAILRDGQGLKF